MTEFSDMYADSIEKLWETVYRTADNMQGFQDICGEINSWILENKLADMGPQEARLIIKMSFVAGFVQATIDCADYTALTKLENVMALKIKNNGDCNE